MDKKEKIVLGTGLIALCAIMFLIGTMFTNAMNNQLTYQIKLKVSMDRAVDDSIMVYDGRRYVGTVALTYGEPYAELILSDNANK